MRCLIVCSALLLLANVALGERAYQRTKDGKTSVWNDNPKPGDTASWVGDRDREGYAKGFGTLTWYTARGDVYARYYGNMIRGKFDGQVNAHSKGKIAHALFTDGTRTSRWVGGPASSRRVGAQPVGPPAKPKEAVAKIDDAPRAITEKPAAPPLPARPAVVERHSEPLRPKADTPSPTQAPSPSPEIVEKRETPVPSETEAQPPPLAPTAPDVAEKREESAPPEVLAKPSPVPAKPAAVASRSPRKGIPKPANPGKPKPGVDDSLRSLVGPPSSLRSSSAAQSKPESAAPTDPNPPLTQEEVIDLGNTVARAHGYRPAEYQPPEAQYSAADDTWSLSYDEKPADGTTEAGKHFAVTVDGKTKKTTIVPGR